MGGTVLYLPPMFRLSAGFWSACLLRACTLGGSGDSEDAGAAGASSSEVCSAPSGSYRASFDEQSGDCGAQVDDTVVFDGTKEALRADCSGSYKSSDGGCSDSFTLECPVGAGQALKRSGTLEWSENGLRASGTLTLTLVTLTTDNAGQVIRETRVCSSQYDVQYVKL
jgi:hypothetical protein